MLSPIELAEIWAAFEDDQFGDIVKLLILTGQRREEIGSLRWSEVDFKRGLIVLPPARTKNKRLHEIPLSALARAILKRQTTRQRYRSLALAKVASLGWSDCKARLMNVCSRNAGGKPKARPLPEWTIT